MLGLLVKGLPEILLLPTVPTHVTHVPHCHSWGTVRKGTELRLSLSVSLSYGLSQNQECAGCGGRPHQRTGWILSMLSAENKVTKNVYEEEMGKKYYEINQAIPGCCDVCNTRQLFSICNLVK